VILNSIQHTARRDHLCASCGMTIRFGERYVRDQVPGGGLVAKKAMHSKCYTALLSSKINKEKAHERNI